MILDKGICTVYKTKKDVVPGNMPNSVIEKMIFQSYYGELNFETAPISKTDVQEDVNISARIRVIQNRTISNYDIAILSLEMQPTSEDTQYQILRAYHGIDDENGQLISDLTLQEVQSSYDLP